MMISDLKMAKQETGLSCEEISTRSGVPLSTVQKIFSGVTKRPRADTIRQLSRAFDTYTPIVRTLGDPGETDVSYDVRAPEMGRVREAARDSGDLALEPAFEPGSRASFQRQGTYRIDDYYRVPDDRRVELIDGVFYDMTAPTTIHQHLVMYVSTRIYNYIDSHHRSCIPFAAPTDVRLDILKDDRTMVQPDVFVVCDEEKVEGACVKGAPDFIVEVLSPATRKKDMTKKLEKYADAGVREYWIIDPQIGRILVYDLENDCKLSMFSFGDRVPVHIYDDLEIDFGAMPGYITKWYDDGWNLITKG